MRRTLITTALLGSSILTTPALAVQGRAPHRRREFPRHVGQRGSGRRARRQNEPLPISAAFRNNQNTISPRSSLGCCARRCIARLRIPANLLMRVCRDWTRQSLISTLGPLTT
jgi:hypothetical protein